MWQPCSPPLTHPNPPSSPPDLAYFVVSQGKADYEKALEDYNHLASFVKDSREAFFYAYAPFEDEVFLEDREEWDDEYADYLLGTKAFPKED